MTVKELKALARRKGCRGYSQMRKAELLEFLKTCTYQDNPTLKELKELAKQLKCKGYSNLRKEDLKKHIRKCIAEKQKKTNEQEAKKKAEAKKFNCTHKKVCKAFNVPQGGFPNRKAYLKWARKEHPDKGGDTKVFQNVSGCYLDNKERFGRNKCNYK